MFPDRKLLRKILTILKNADNSISSASIRIKGYEGKIITDHIKYLIDEGSVTGKDASDTKSEDMLNMVITNSGLQKTIGEPIKILNIICTILAIMVSVATIIAIFL